MADYVTNLGFSTEMASYLGNLGEALGITSFINRETIGVLNTITSGSLYFANFEANFFEYYSKREESMVDFVERINAQSINESTAKICYVNEEGVKSYFTIESDTFNMRVSGAPSQRRRSGGILTFSYNSEQMEFLEQNYGDIEPALQISLNIDEGTTNLGFQNTIENNEISYNSISSLGAISQEDFTISAVTGSATGLITEQAETITDVGGLSGAGRDRTIIGGGVGGANVTTSGY